MTQITAVKVAGTKFGPKGDAELVIRFAVPPKCDTNMSSFFSQKWQDRRYPKGLGVRISTGDGVPRGELIYNPRFNADLENAELPKVEELMVYINDYMAEVNALYPTWEKFMDAKNHVEGLEDKMPLHISVSANYSKDTNGVWVSGNLHGEYFEGDPLIQDYIRAECDYTTFHYRFMVSSEEAMMLTVEDIASKAMPQIIDAAEKEAYWGLAVAMAKTKLGDNNINYDHPSWNPSEGKSFTFKILPMHAFKTDPGLAMDMKDAKTFYNYLNNLTDADIKAFQDMFKVQEAVKKEAEEDVAYKKEMREERKAFKAKKEGLEADWNKLRADLAKLMVPQKTP